MCNDDRLLADATTLFADFSEPVREHIESSESFVIQGGGLIRLGVADVDEKESRTL